MQDTLLKWAWAVVMALGGVVWALIEARLRRIEKEAESLEDRFESQAAETRRDLGEVYADMQKAMTAQAATNLRVAEALGELRGEIASFRKAAK